MPETSTADQPDASQVQATTGAADLAPTPADGQQADGKQQTFDAEYVAKLRAENAKYRTAAKDNADAAKQLAKLQQENQQLKQDALKTQVAAAKNIPDPALLVGTTLEELEAHADKLLAFRGQTPPPDFGAGQRGDTPPTIDSLNRQIAEAQKAGDTRRSVALQRQRYALQQAGS